MTMLIVAFRNVAKGTYFKVIKSRIDKYNKKRKRGMLLYTVCTKSFNISYTLRYIKPPELAGFILSEYLVFRVSVIPLIIRELLKCGHV